MSSTSSLFNVGGLVSGLDTNTMVDQLTAIEQQKVTAIQTKQSDKQVQITSLGTLQGMLSTLSSKASSLSTLDSFSLFKSSSSDDTYATIGGSGEGIQGNIGVNIRQLATSLKVASKPMADQITNLGASGTLTISKSAAAIKVDPTNATINVSISKGDTLKDVASKINAASGTGVTAAIVNFGTGDTRLMLNGVDEGSQSFKMTEASGGNVLSTLGLTSSSSTTASDFSFKLQAGGPATSASTLGSLYTGIGANNVSANDSLSLDWSNGSNSGSTTLAAGNFTDSTTGKPKTDMSQVTVGDVASYMSTEMGVPVSVDASGRLVATDPKGGNLDFSLAMGSGSTGTIPLGGSTAQTSWANVLHEGQNAFYTMNGLSVMSQTNSDSTTLTGATINLHKVSLDTTSQVQLTLDRDKSTIQSNIQSFLDAYNVAIKYIKDNTTSIVTSTKDANGATVNKVTPGTLTYDTNVGGLQSKLRSMITSPVQGLSSKTNYDSLASVGITTEKDTGNLTIDSTKFQTALAADFDGVRRLFANSGWTDNGSSTVGGWTNSTKSGTYTLNPATDVVDGKSANRVGDILFSQSGNSKGLGVTAPSSITGDVKATFARGVAGQLQQYVANLTAFDGSFKADTTSIQKQVDSYSNDITAAQSRVDSYRKNLVAQFSGMESAMLKIKNQSSAFSAQIHG